MKPGRRSSPHSAQARRPRVVENRGRSLGESKCLVCGQVVDAMKDGSLETAAALPSPIEGDHAKAAEKRPSRSVDLERVLHFSEQLYAHALTLQELIRNEGEVAYAVLRPRYDRQAAEQFEVFYDTLKQPPAVRKRVVGAGE